MVEKDVMAFFDIFVVALFDPSIFATVKEFDVTQILSYCSSEVEHKK
jgi:hypothetical protein